MVPNGTIHLKVVYNRKNEFRPQHLFGLVIYSTLPVLFSVHLFTLRLII